MRILVNDPIVKEAIDLLRAKHEVDVKEYDAGDLLSKIPRYDAIIVRSRTKMTADIIKEGENLKVIGRAGVGVDNIDVGTATERKIPVVFSPRGSTVSVAELAIGHMLSLARNLVISDRSVRAGKWEKKRFVGTELQDKVLGLVGAGRIGAEVTKRAKAFGMRVLAFDPYLNEEIAAKIGVELVDLHELLSESDFVSIHAVLSPETKGIIGKEELEMMKKSAYLVNCARGGIIDERALADGLREGLIAGAALDVFENEPPKDSPLLNLDNVHFTPHLGASTIEAQERAGTMVAEQVLMVLDGGVPDQVVNREIYD
ncbi:MAG: hydroxyacid dehydrogenase [Thermoplasmata archaeon]